VNCYTSFVNYINRTHSQIPFWMLNPRDPSGKRTAVNVRYTAQQAEISISLRWGIIDLSKVLRMVLPSIGSQFNYAVCRKGNNPIFFQWVTDCVLRRSLVSCGFLDLPAGLTWRTSFLYFPLVKIRYRLTVACFTDFAVCLCLAVYFAKVASTKCKQDCLHVFDILEGRSAWQRVYISVCVFV
jgi:hypothetical protein